MTVNAKFTKCSFQGRKMYYVDGDEIRTGTVVAAFQALDVDYYILASELSEGATITFQKIGDCSLSPQGARQAQSVLGEEFYVIE